MNERNTNHVTLPQFDNMDSDEKEDEIPLDQIYRLQWLSDLNKKWAIDLDKRLNSSILRRCESAGRAALKQLGKDTGTATIVGDDDYNYKIEIPKKVEWNQAELRKVADALAAEGKNPEEYLIITLGVSETKYNAWPSDIKARFQDARMVRDGSLKAEVVEAKRK